MLSRLDLTALRVHVQWPGGLESGWMIESQACSGSEEAARSATPGTGGQKGGWGRSIKHKAPTGACARPAQATLQGPAQTRGIAG